MSHEDALRKVYQDFASFGATRGAVVLMDGPKFAKFAKDCKLVDRSFTATDVDLVFAKAKSKTERRITFEQFHSAVCMIADKKYPDQAGEEALKLLMEKINSSHGPKATATVADSSGIYGKLTDSSLYTGTHKERFNTDGTGKGLEGRESIPKGKGSVKGEDYTPENGGNSPSPPVSDEEESNEYLAGEVAKLGIKSTTTTTTTTTPTKPSLSKSGPAKSPSAKSLSKSGAKPSPAKPSLSKSSPAKASAPSVFDKLTDSSLYTGTHKNRFNSDGSGRGLAGRDSVRKGGISGQDLSQMVKRS